MLSVLILYYCLTTPFIEKIWMFSATQLKKDEEAIVSPLTMVRGMHHGLTVVSARADFLLFPCSKDVAVHGCQWGGQNTSMRVKCWVKRPKILQNTSNNHT